MLPHKSLVIHTLFRYLVTHVSESPNPSPASTAPTSSELELIEQLKRQLAGPLFTPVSSQLESYQNRPQ
jgi:hypothetical protein